MRVPDEKTLVNEVLAGDKHAFVEFVQRYERLVLHIVTPLVGAGTDREDICQDVFLKVYQNLSSFRFESSLATWIGRIAYNLSVNLLKRKKSLLLGDLTTTGLPIEFIVDDGDSPEELSIRKQDAARLRMAIDNLPEIQRTVLLLFYDHELRADEIGEILGMPVNTVKSHLFRSRQSLKEALA
jgi:RNA polymerase sigma factor (sigma-70 family)